MNLHVKAVVGVMVLISPFVVYAATTPLPHCVMTSSSMSVSPGTIVRLYWSSTDAARATLGGVGSVPLQGSYDVRPQKNTTYTMTVSNPYGSRTCAALVTMERPQPSYTYPTAYSPVYAPAATIYSALPVTQTYYEYYYDPYPYRYSYEYSYQPATYTYEYSSNPYSYSSAFDEYTVVTPYTRSNGYGASITEECVYGDCVVTGMNREIPYDENFFQTAPSAQDSAQNPSTWNSIPPSTAADPNMYTEDWWLRQPPSNQNFEEPLYYPPPVSNPEILEI
jgi:hypothetical protein